MQSLYNREGQDLNLALMSYQVYNSKTSPALMHLCPSFQNNRHLFLVKHRGQKMTLILFKWDSDWRDSNLHNYVAVRCWEIFSFWNCTTYTEMIAEFVGLERKAEYQRLHHLLIERIPTSWPCFQGQLCCFINQNLNEVIRRPSNQDQNPTFFNFNNQWNVT